MEQIDHEPSGKGAKYLECELVVGWNVKDSYRPQLRTDWEAL